MQRPNFTWYFSLILLPQSIRIVRMWRKTKLHMILLVDTRPQSIRIRVSRWSSSILLAQSIESAISILFTETRGTRAFRTESIPVHHWHRDEEVAKTYAKNYSVIVLYSRACRVHILIFNVQWFIILFCCFLIFRRIACVTHWESF